MKTLFQFSVSSQKKSKRWYMEHINDFYVRESKRLQLRSRAAFKLMQINEKYKLFSNNQLVLDLGAAPGSWSQVLAETCNVIAIDLLDIAPLQNVKFIKGNIMDQKILHQLQNYQFDVILSDMAPNLSGNNDLDHQEITQFNQIVLLLCNLTLKNGGNTAMKTFVGSEEKVNFDFCKMFFKEFYREKPLSSKQESRELFYVGKGFDQKVFQNYLQNLNSLNTQPPLLKERLKTLIIEFKMLE